MVTRPVLSALRAAGSSLDSSLRDAGHFVNAGEKKGRVMVMNAYMHITICICICHMYIICIHVYIYIYMLPPPSRTYLL